jgi:RNAse (barnase) inhibitor barstar
LEFAEQGGKIIALEEKPVNSEINFPDSEVRESFEKLFSTNKNIVFIADWNVEKLNELLNSWLKKPIQLDNENLPVRLAHRKIDGKDVIFLINDSNEEINTNLSFNITRKFEEWDPATAEIKKVKDNFQLVLKPYQGKVYKN